MSLGTHQGTGVIAHVSTCSPLPHFLLIHLHSSKVFFHGNRDVVDQAIKEVDCAISEKDRLIEQHNSVVKCATQTARLDER